VIELPSFLAIGSVIVVLKPGGPLFVEPAALSQPLHHRVAARHQERIRQHRRVDDGADRWCRLVAL
jgi:hypothetical protein